jgi:bacterial/archaeal transporter family-2 protein
MGNIALIVVVAVVGGIAVALQSQFMGLLDKGIGTLEGVFITYGTGGLLIAVIMLLQRGGNLGAWQGVPWYAFCTGALGLVIVGAIGYSTPRLGLVVTFTIMVASQFIVGSLLDHFGILGAASRPIEMSRLFGMAVLLLGIWLIIR